jgi:predicted small metal-binding protein
MATAMFDCARVPEEKNCSVKIIGDHDDVLRAAHDHMVNTHGATADDLQEKVKRVVAEHQTTYGMWGH